MSIRKSTFAKALAQLTELILKESAHRNFNTRKNWNEETVWALTKGILSNDFQDKLKNIQATLNIPKLNPDIDIKVVPSPYPELSDSDMEESSWIHSQSDEFINEFELLITAILSEFNLPNNFRGWVEYWVLYRKEPKGFPDQYFDVSLDALMNHKSMELVALTDSEKRLARKLIPKVLGFTKKPPKHLAFKYKEVLTALETNKNTNRRLRSFPTAKVASMVGVKHSNYGEAVLEAFTEDEEFEIGGEKLKARLRKQKQRLLKRYSPK